MAAQYVGAPVPRREDPRLITGQDAYVADVELPNALHLAVARSPFAHAEIRRIDAVAARGLPGVVAVLTGADLNPHLGTIDMIIPVEEFDQVNVQGRQALAQERVRYVGEPVAVVVADTPWVAVDGLGALAIEYAPLPAVTDAEAALAPGAPLVYPHLATNVAVRWSRAVGDVDAAFARATVVVEARLSNQRVLAAAVEPRGLAASYDAASEQLTLWASTQAPHWLRDWVAEHLGMAADRVRVIAPRVGGGFGSKIALYSEDLIVAYLAKNLKRPVRWVATRREDLQATSHGRDMVAHLRLAADRSGRIQALDARVIGNLGWCLFSDGPFLPVLAGQMVTGCYDIRTARVEVLGAFTNTMGTAAYRGAGRPEAAYFIERMLNILAAKLDVDPAEVRRRNFIPPEAFPYQAPMGPHYDSGNYRAALEAVLARADYAGLRAEQARARRAGRLPGIGLSCYVEMCGFVDEEVSDVIVGPDARVTVLTGASPHGQGHETSFAQLVADELQLPLDRIAVVHSDTTLVRKGTGTFGSRSIARGGMAAVANARRVRDKARRIAAHLLEAMADDVVLEGGVFQVRGVPDRRVTWAEVAGAAVGGKLPADLEPGLEAREDFVGQGLLFPFGAHLAVVEVDPETGVVELTRYVTVDDSGLIVNPLLAAGQVHGGVAQGIGQALYEAVTYDEAGQLLSGSLMDYALPKAADLPGFETGHTVTPSPRTALGVKGIGESATIGSTPAIANAVLDALAPFGVEHLDLPLTPEKIWRAIRARRRAEGQ
ncbi:MAG: xanthine dehydrogenase family protein molybdopterin-binding subunit [Candidatus Rokubacteria bacterium]|nr:xanthine dehydrogenase family protein molybdopterin-binding subunit [Candidatus Rokubacteria bacterium]